MFIFLYISLSLPLLLSLYLSPSLDSVANLIVVERAKASYRVGFLEYLRFGAPSTLCIVAVGTLVTRATLSVP
jgi:hypothetical protein